MGIREALNILGKMVWSGLKGIVELIRDVRREQKRRRGVK